MEPGFEIGELARLLLDLQHLDNLADALEPAFRFQDTRLRSALLRNLEAGLRPFEHHPGMTHVTAFAY